MVIGLMRGAIKTIIRTIAIHHTNIKGTVTIIKMTSLIVPMTEDTPRLQNPPRTVKVATMPTMWKRVKPLLTIIPTLVALIPLSRKSKGSLYDHLHESALEASLQVRWKRTITFSPEISREG
jgi:hypothetical protein